MDEIEKSLATLVMQYSREYEADARSTVFLRIRNVAIRKRWSTNADLPLDYIRNRIRLEIRRYMQKERRCRLLQGKELT
jgi:hypothetical protein